jgi:nitroreductase
MNPKVKLHQLIIQKALAIKKPLVIVIFPLLILSIAVTIINHKKGRKPLEVQPNSTIATLINSGSTRAFINQQIDAQTIDLIVKCGIKAPSALNRQPWHFCIIQNRKIINKINYDSIAARRQDNPDQKPSSANQHFFSHAPVVIVFSVAPDSDWALFDTALACENMSIAAQSLGLGTRIVTAPIAVLNGPKTREYHRLLKIPPNKRPVAALVLGIPDYSPDAVGRATSRTANVISLIK